VYQRKYPRHLHCPVLSESLLQSGMECPLYFFAHKRDSAVIQRDVNAESMRKLRMGILVQPLLSKSMALHLKNQLVLSPACCVITK